MDMAFVITSIPEPGSLMLLLVALAPLGIAARSRQR
jgi:hypothetical protein